MTCSSKPFLWNEYHVRVCLCFLFLWKRAESSRSTGLLVFPQKVNKLFALAKVHRALAQHYLIHILRAMLPTSCACLLLSQQINIVAPPVCQACHVECFCPSPACIQIQRNMGQSGFYTRLFPVTVTTAHLCTQHLDAVCSLVLHTYLLVALYCPPKLPLLSTRECQGTEKCA